MLASTEMFGNRNLHELVACDRMLWAFVDSCFQHREGMARYIKNTWTFRN